MISHVPHLSMSGINSRYRNGVEGVEGVEGLVSRVRGVHGVISGSVIDTITSGSVDSSQLGYDSNDEDMITTCNSRNGHGHGHSHMVENVVIKDFCVNVHDVIQSLNKNIYEFGMYLDMYIRRHELLLSNDSIIPINMVREFKGSRHSRRLKAFIQSLRNQTMGEGTGEGGMDIIEKWNDYTLNMMVSVSPTNEAEIVQSIAQFRAYHADVLADWSYITMEVIEAIRHYTTTNDKEAIADVFRRVVIVDYIERTIPLRLDVERNIPIIMRLMRPLLSTSYATSNIVNCYEDKYNIMYNILAPEWKHETYDVSNISIMVRQLETEWLECETVRFKYDDVCYIINWVYEETYMTQDTMEKEYIDTMNGITQKYIERYYMKAKYTRIEDVIEKIVVWWRAVFKEMG
jgi:hypothetical protein